MVARIMHCLRSGESCAIVGVSSMGKGNLFRFLLRSDVRQEYLAEEWEQYLLLYVDCNELTKLSEWNMYAMLLRCMVEAVESLKEGDDLVAHFKALYQSTAAAHDDLLIAQGNFSHCVKALCKDRGMRLVLLLDEFDGVFQRMDSRFFRNLRAIRDRYKYRVCYVVATRNELSRIRENVEECESFYELFSDHTYGLKPYDETDACTMVKRLEARGGKVLPKADASLLIKTSGGHAGLLRAAFWALCEGRVDRGTELLPQLVTDVKVQEECRKIWDSLGEDERKALFDLTADLNTAHWDREVGRLLRMKGLVVEDQTGQAAIFCKLFEDFVGRQKTLEVEDIRLDEKSGEVWLEGKLVCPDLTNLEFSLLFYLYKRRGEICSRSELLEALYPGEPRDPKLDMTDNRLDTLIARLRDKIELDRRRPKYIIAVRGRGFKLAEATPENP